MGRNILFNRKKTLESRILEDEDIEYFSMYGDAVKRLKQDKVSIFCFYILIVIVFIGIFAPLFAPYDPSYQNVTNILVKPSREHLLGTDELGRDILSRIIHGSRVSLSVGIIAETIAIVIGTTMGALAGYYGGKVDMLISRLIEIFASFPQILFAITIMFIMGPGVINVFIAIGFVGWTGLARIIRSQVIQLKEEQYIEACIVSGGKGLRIIFKHLIPNCLSTIIVVATMNIPGNIMYEASLSFLGLGVQPPRASWGSMINGARIYIRTTPGYSIYPGVAIIITVLAFNILGDGLRDALDPQSKNL